MDNLNVKSKRSRLADAVNQLLNHFISKEQFYKRVEDIYEKKN